MQQPAEEKEEIYAVQPHDTLVTIAVKFGLTVQWLRDLNNISSDFIYNDMKLIIKPPNILDTILVAENVSILSEDLQILPENEQVLGKLTCKGALLAFIPYSKGTTLFVDLCGNLEHTHLPSPAIKSGKHISSRDPELLIITFFPDINDLSKTETLAFVGSSMEITPLSDLIGKQTKEIQRRMNFTPVRPQHNDSKTEKVVQKKAKLQSVELRGTSTIADENMIEQVRRYLPYQFRLANWNLLFQLSNDGASYLTFFEKCKDKSPAVILIRTDSGDKIGAYISAGFKLSKRFYGNGETFVFTFNPKLHAYRWQNSNQYFICSTKEEIAIGGGGSTAIWIDGTFLNAVSDPCTTFGSPSLTKTPYFKIHELEVWSISQF
ncbi:TLD family protein [Trichomonas vaginalis G3]|uniref:Oxidation resistance protein 1 n=1 Tax=Trichomonas vaginalis (strain ATCC PRA-98 / G3) TaxID=412133 RepID=A2FTF7_TRIV3|nr:negative regulation of peptidyl-cysteine S-nitrosylation [Trichomonas vaginalis G3]EAX91807.1 TLD family protein [Trichomonas vaginalis G3]KAI5538259.1 negative regulation of peptidyl-cysteine S-nitrosylation [Trichomonas vaginalis G3]|eukprot:XP_001304737.1 TLD family protein [Trichomonas vaginalis G3]